MALDVRDFNAVGDGKTDSTASIQKALDKAAKTNGTVFIPEGVFVCSTLKLPALRGHLRQSHLGIWQRIGVLFCDLGDSVGPCLPGRNGGLWFPDQWIMPGRRGSRQGHPRHPGGQARLRRQGCTIFFENCRISHFSGDGLHLSRIWVFSIRHCIIAYNKGCGFRFRGWDGFVIDNWFSGNGVAGIGAYEENAACTFTANRIEWNPHGMLFKAGHGYNITGNYFDRTSGPGLALFRARQQPARPLPSPAMSSFGAARRMAGHLPIPIKHPSAY